MAVFLWKNVFHTTKGRMLQQRRASLYNGAHGYDEELIKKKLQQFAGGSVNLSKEHSGIGILTLNNSRLMNAFTGINQLMRMLVVAFFSPSLCINKVKSCIVSFLR